MKVLLMFPGGVSLGVALHWMGADAVTTLAFAVGLVCIIVSCPGVHFEDRS